MPSNCAASTPDSGILLKNPGNAALIVGEPDCILPSESPPNRMTVQRVVLVILLLLCIAPSTRAQQASHSLRLAEVTAGCLEAAIETQDAFRFLAQGQSELVASPLVSTWTREGKSVYLEPSDVEAPLLVVTTDRSDVTLLREGRSAVRRIVSVDLTWWLSSVEGDVLATDTCREAIEDRLTRADARALAVDGSPVLDPALPRKSRILGAAEPIVLLGATAVGTYLLFNLRSRRSDDG